LPESKNSFLSPSSQPPWRALSNASKHYNKRKTHAELMDFAPAALVKLNSEKLMGDVAKLTKKNLRSFISFLWHTTQGGEYKGSALFV
jgi:hypothetical protein